MNNKIKLLGSALGICLISSNAWAADKGQWQLNGSYEKGDTVTNLGASYECLVAGWCSGGNKLYEPGVKGNEWAWQTAWKEAGPGPSPTPQEKVTATISVSNDIPEGTTINFKGSNGYTVSGKNNSQIVLEYDKDGSTTYKVSIDSKVGNITPESITVDQNTSSISLKYAKPTPPTPGKCDPEPSNIEDFVPSGPGHWGGYSKGDFVKYEGNIYELLDSYWTADAPGTPNTWVKCGSVISATVNVTTVGLPSDVKSYPLKIDQQQYTVSVLSPEAISLAKGQHSFSVDPVMSSSDVQNYYIGTPSPKNIDVTKNKHD
jgi:chitinase